MNDLTIDLDSFLIEDAKGDPELLDAYFEAATEQFEEEEYAVCQDILRTYIIGAELLDKTSSFLNMSSEDLLKKLSTKDSFSKEHLSKLIGFLKLDFPD